MLLPAAAFPLPPAIRRKPHVRLGEAMLALSLPGIALRHFLIAERLDSQGPQQFSAASALQKKQVLAAWQREALCYAPHLRRAPSLQLSLARGGLLGKGLEAKQPIRQGQVFLEEQPLLALQSHRNESLVKSCVSCHRVVGSIPEQLAALLGASTAKKRAQLPPTLPLADALWRAEFRPATVECAHCGLAAYCSEACRERDWGEKHALLCMGAKSPAQVTMWLQFLEIAKSISCPRLVMVAQLLARVFSQAKASLNEAKSSDQQVHLNHDCESNESKSSNSPSSHQHHVLPSQKPANVVRREFEANLLDLEAQMQACSSDLPQLESTLCRWNAALVSMCYPAPPPPSPLDPFEPLLVSSPFWRSAVRPFAHYHRGSWRHLRVQAVTLKGKKAAEDVDELDRQWFSAIRSAICRLKLFFPPSELGFDPAPVLGSVDCWDWLLGMLALNDATYEIDHPIRAYLVGLGTKTPPHLQAGVGGVIQPLLRVINTRHPSGDLSAHGEALYPLHACINHSCQPNAKQIPGEVDGRVLLQALRDIPAGEPISISYVDKKKSKEDRRLQLLTTFGFDCQCELCQS